MGYVNPASMGGGAIQSNIGGFAGGAITGAVSGFGSGFLTGAGMAWSEGASFGDGLKAGLINGGIGALTGGVAGGMVGGIDAAMNGRNFWDGAQVIREYIQTDGIPNSTQRGANDCVSYSTSAVDESFGGDCTPADIRSQYGGGGNPETVPLKDVSTLKSYAISNGRSIKAYGENYETHPKLGISKTAYVHENMRSGGRVIINQNVGGNVGHVVVMKSITRTTRIHVNGQVNFKHRYYVMDPGVGRVVPISVSNITNSYNIFSIH
jgi:hypothetical protein